MKKIIIVNNNMDSGGIQKSLLNLLKEISGEFDVTLLLFSQTGALMSDIPENIKIKKVLTCYKILGLSRKELEEYPLLFALKAFLKIFASLFGKRKALALLGLFQKKVKGYDIAISYSHLTSSCSFENCCAEFVIDKTEAERKSCFVHCDYKDSGMVSDENNKLYQLFDEIVCVSDSVRKRLTETVPELSLKVLTIRNFYDPEVLKKATEDPVNYNDSYINLIIVARLSPEKGINRAINALSSCERKDIKLHIVGSGPSEKELKILCESVGVKENVVFYGEQKNPYRYMKNADWMLISSLHEAAPMVIDEAHSIGLPIISTKLLSTEEMLFEDDMECDNSEEGIANVLRGLKKSKKSESYKVSNAERLENFRTYVKGRI